MVEHGFLCVEISEKKMVVLNFETELQQNRFFQYFRMTTITFEELLALIGPPNTNPSAINLSYLTTGNT